MPLFADNVRTLYASLIVVALVVAAFVLGQDILIPLALATLIAFILNPIVRRLMRLRVPEGLAVAIVLSGVIAGTAAMSTMLTTQMLSLTADLQTYRQNLVEKVRYVTAFGKGEGAIKRATEAVDNLGTAIGNELRNGGPAPSSTLPELVGPPRQTTPGEATSPEASRPVANQVATQQAGRRPAETARPPEVTGERTGSDKDGQPISALKIVGEPLAKIALTILFTLFLLLQHQDLRDRIVRVAGTDNLSGTTAAMDDAGTRLSQLFLAQALLNVGFGIFVGTALAVIGVPNPVLWGVLTAIMRFVPFIGSFISAIPPIVLAAAVDPGWGMAIATLLLFAIGEPLMGHVVEPLVLGKKAGLSPFAMVVSASLWTLIWGPIGLILAAPLTMLLVVLGRYIPALEVVSVSLGDEPALSAEQELYGRVLAGDEIAAVAQISDAVAATSVVEVNDTILLPALHLASIDIRRGKIDGERVALAGETMRAIIDVMTDTETGESGRAKSAETARPSTLIIPARGAIDGLAAELISNALAKSAGIETTVVTGSAGLSALAHQRDHEKGKDYDAVVFTTVGGVDPRHLAIMLRRAGRDFPGARVSALDFGANQPPGVTADASDPLPRFENLAKLAASLDFTPTRRQERAASPAAALRPAMAS